MNSITTNSIISGVLIVITIVSGIIISNLGRPLNTALFTIHKLASLAAIILFMVTTIRLYNSLEAQTSLQLLMIVITGVLFLALLVSGGFMSVNDSYAVVFLRIHQIVPLLSIASSVYAVVLLINTGS